MAIAEDFPKGHWIHGVVAKEKARLTAKKGGKTPPVKGDPKMNKAAPAAGQPAPIGPAPVDQPSLAPLPAQLPQMGQ
jgi:hypothetical protein